MTAQSTRPVPWVYLIFGLLFLSLAVRDALPLFRGDPMSAFHWVLLILSVLGLIATAGLAMRRPTR